MAAYRVSMLKPERDEPRWTINGRTMRADGPWLKNEGQIEVVPAERLEEALDLLRELSEKWTDVRVSGNAARVTALGDAIGRAYKFTGPGGAVAMAFEIVGSGLFVLGWPVSVLWRRWRAAR